MINLVDQFWKIICHPGVTGIRRARVTLRSLNRVSRHVLASDSRRASAHPSSRFETLGASAVTGWLRHRRRPEGRLGEPADAMGPRSCPERSTVGTTACSIATTGRASSRRGAVSTGSVSWPNWLPVATCAPPSPEEAEELPLRASFPDRPAWVFTEQGNQLANASAARPLRRASVEKALAGFLDRVDEVETDPLRLTWPPK